ncbi:uncharacterized protein LOC135470578 isoform X2 [Liolophura sinensis]|uniref:uncharacterized protein LOC135470578 isoform X2 n=1 Tax=Liolophura sinensis TaxID=3198878 RepID=UPI003159276B
MSSNESDVELDELFRKTMVEKASSNLAEVQLRPAKNSKKSRSDRSTKKGTDSEREMKNLKSSQEKLRKKVGQHMSLRGNKTETQKIHSPDPEIHLLSPGTSISKLSNKYRNVQKSGDVPSKERVKRKQSSSRVPRVTERNRRGSSEESDLETSPLHHKSLCVPGDDKMQVSVMDFSEFRSSDSVQSGPIKGKQKTKKLKHKSPEKSSGTHVESPVKTKHTETKDKPSGSPTSVQDNKTSALMVKKSSNGASPYKASTSSTLAVNLDSDSSSEEDTGISKTFHAELMRKQIPLRRTEKQSISVSKSSPKPPTPSQDTDIYQFNGSGSDSSSEEDIGISKTFEAEMLRRQQEQAPSRTGNHENVEVDEGFNIDHQGCLWYEEDSSEKTDLWLVRAPAGLDLNNMKGKALLLQGVQSLGPSELGNNSFEVQASKERTNEMINVQPVVSNSKKMVAEIRGLLSIVQSVAVPPVLIPAAIVPAPKPLPEGLKARFQPLGSGSPVRNSGSQHSKKKKKKHKRHLSESPMVHQTEVIVDESSVEDDPHEAIDVRKRKKERDCYTDVEDYQSVTKRRKKKHSRDKYDYYTDVDDVTKRKKKQHSGHQSGYYTDVNDSRPVTKRKRKKQIRDQSDYYTDVDDEPSVFGRKKTKHSQDQSESSATRYSEVLADDHHEPSGAHKKKKKKKKHKEHSY